MANPRKPTETDALEAARRVFQLEAALKQHEEEGSRLREELEAAREQHRRIFAEAFHRTDDGQIAPESVNPHRKIRMGSQAEKIVEFLAKQAKPVGHRDVAGAVGSDNPRAVRGALWYLAKLGLAENLGKDRWKATTARPV